MHRYNRALTQMPSKKTTPIVKVKAREDEGRPPDVVVDDTQKTTPKLKPIAAVDRRAPETGIGARIEDARNQLGLSVEALARYTAHFDHKERRGISASTMLRYESGDPLPGARELRILCDALDVPPLWLLYGKVSNAGEDPMEQGLLAALEDYVVARANEVRLGGKPVRKLFPVDPAQRRRWIAEARSPKPPK